MFTQRAQALAERRTRIRQYADRWIWVNFTPANYSMHYETTTSIRIQIESSHNDGELEHLPVLDFCESMCKNTSVETKTHSWQELADCFHEALSSKYPGRSMKIEISDSETGGCLIEYLTSKSRTISV